MTIVKKKIFYIFSDISTEYIKEKEEAAEKKRIKHLTAWQADRKSDHEMWEKNRMLRSGQLDQGKDVKKSLKSECLTEVIKQAIVH